MVNTVAWVPHLCLSKCKQPQHPCQVTSSHSPSVSAHKFPSSMAVGPLLAFGGSTLANMELVPWHKDGKIHSRSNRSWRPLAQGGQCWPRLGWPAAHLTVLDQPPSSPACHSQRLCYIPGQVPGLSTGAREGGGRKTISVCRLQAWLTWLQPQDETLSLGMGLYSKTEFCVLQVEGDAYSFKNKL